MNEAREEFVARACAFHPDLPPENAHRLFTEIEGWSGYGFIEGHAASFALTGYRTAYLSVHYAAEYFAGLLNHQPMGYYPPNTLAGEARRRGVTILPIDINASDDKCHADGQGGLRLGLRLVERLGEADRMAILGARQEGSGGGPFVSLLDFCARVVLARDRLENLILGGAFDALHGAHRRRGLLLRLDETLSLAHAYRAQDSGVGPQRALPFGSWREIPTPVAVDVPGFSEWERFCWAWRITGVCADAHPLARYRPTLSAQGVLTAYDAQRQPPQTRMAVAGLNIRPHRPPTRSGRTVLFTTVEDETDLLQVVCTGQALEKYTAVFLLSPAVLVEGVIEHQGRGASLLVERAEPLHLSDAAPPIRERC
jgi:error-prone DNA polymerase